LGGTGVKTCIGGGDNFECTRLEGGDDEDAAISAEADAADFEGEEKGGDEGGGKGGGEGGGFCCLAATGLVPFREKQTAQALKPAPFSRLHTSHNQSCSTTSTAVAVAVLVVAGSVGDGGNDDDDAVAWSTDNADDDDDEREGDQAFNGEVRGL